jgi:BirA family transcriptional regulator, biotin operon repressor / biotin---[acetyl-CoA-carboxylase] ligase
LLKNTGWNTILIKECDSTNSQIKLLKAKHDLHDRTAIVTEFQTNGRGQGRNSWHSLSGENLLASFYREIKIPVSQNFMLTVITSLALYRLLLKIGIKSLIKWPNDIYVKNKKIAGILIENSLMRSTIIDTIIGVGLNVNETDFPEWLQNPDSLKRIRNNEFDLEEIRIELIEQLELIFTEFEDGKAMELYHTYNTLLYRLNNWSVFRKGELSFNARIHGVELDGRLILEAESGELMHLTFGEVEYII